MANKTIGELTAATTPLSGAELVHVVQAGNSRKVATSELITPSGDNTEAATGTGTTAKAWPATAIKASALVWGSTFASHSWADVSGSRSINTSYQNTSGSAKMVAGRWKNSTITVFLQVSANNSTWITVGDSAGYPNGLDASALVPVGHYYRVSVAGGTTTTQFWAELSV